MSEQAIVERIISDAEEEAKAIISSAEIKAEETVQKAMMRAERRKEGERQSAERKAESILDGSAATARLDCAKILLAEKRAVIDEIYLRALNQLKQIGKADALYLFEHLLKEYAEEGDEIVFADNFLYAQDVAKLSVVRERKLKVSSKKAKIDGGLLLIGKNSDKDLSFSALLAEDRELMQAEIASVIFG